jgi:hypothetical protein
MSKRLKSEVKQWMNFMKGDTCLGGDKMLGPFSARRWAATEESRPLLLDALAVSMLTPCLAATSSIGKRCSVYGGKIKTISE